MASAWTAEVLSQYVFRPFWVTWSKSQVVLGRGHVINKDPILTYSDTVGNAVHLVAMTGTADWQFTSYNGK